VTTAVSRRAALAARRLTCYPVKGRQRLTQPTAPQVESFQVGR
jgi:hypothetical protein